MQKTKKIIEKQLGIAGDYQYKALRSGNFLQANWHANKWSAVGKMIDLYKPSAVLDLGTGSGNFELLFAGKVKNIVGVDYNDEALKFLKSKLTKRTIKNVSLFQGDILQVGKKRGIGKFDMAIAVDVLEHLDFSKNKKFFTDLKSLLKPSGKVVIITPNYGGTWPAVEKMIDRFTRIPHLENMQHITKLNADNLRRYFEKAGYKTKLVTTINVFSYLSPDKKLANLLCGYEMNLYIPFGNLLFCVFEKQEK